MAMIDTNLDLTSGRDVTAAEWFGESLSAFAPSFPVPSLLVKAALGAQSCFLAWQRTLADRAAPPRPFAKGEAAAFAREAAQARLRLWTDPALVDEDLQIRKVHNLYIAANALDRLVLRKGEIFSFWAQIGRPSKARGYVTGRFFRNGRMEKKPGVGLSQLSSALYEGALLEGSNVLERHARPLPAPGTNIAACLDTMVTWRYADLRFRASRDLMLRVTFEKGFLMVRLLAA